MRFNWTGNKWNITTVEEVLGEINKLFDGNNKDYIK
jgi:hypothetical protein